MAELLLGKPVSRAQLEQHDRERLVDAFVGRQRLAARSHAANLTARRL